ncbi:flagellar export chaperone FlgN [Desulfallas thermosapovorans]|uniref:Flagellar protein FliT n=1 Tax=Desulfallas thermosapovorans DSM 6562 TaxID=1121431 RepID=A0A5S4ZS60_9FIRM|nr:flagellar export chaperone FlgN [Desulfallas thermosapovorans]TYO95492.1 FlgN protein [Desulfallas thermosapovorans DSM 6562]
MNSDDLIAGMLDQKLELLGQFCALTESMLNALGDEDMQRFNDLLECRQDVIDRVNDLDVRLAKCGIPFSPGDIRPEGVQPGARQQITGEINACLTKAREMDRQIHTIIQQRYRDLTKNASAVRVARQAENIYRKKTASRYGYFIDKKK